MKGEEMPGAAADWMIQSAAAPGFAARGFLRFTIYGSRFTTFPASLFPAVLADEEGDGDEAEDE